MQKTIVLIHYMFDGTNMLMPFYQKFQESSVVILDCCGFSYGHTCMKISADEFQTCARSKSFIIFANSDIHADSLEYVYDHQRKLIGSNKNMCFGCSIYFDPNYGNYFNMIDYIPDGVSRFVVFHHPINGYCAPKANFDLRGLFHLRSLYHCFSGKHISDNMIFSYNDDKSVVRYNKFDFKLPYGCVTKIIDDFDKLTE